MEILGICTNGTDLETQKVVREMGLSFKMAQDGIGIESYKQALGIKGLPCLVLLDRGHRVVQIFNDFYLSDLEKCLSALSRK